VFLVNKNGQYILILIYIHMDDTRRAQLVSFFGDCDESDEDSCRDIHIILAKHMDAILWIGMDKDKDTEIALTLWVRESLTPEQQAGGLSMLDAIADRMRKAATNMSFSLGM